MNEKIHKNDLGKKEVRTTRVSLDEDDVKEYRNGGRQANILKLIEK